MELFNSIKNIKDYNIVKFLSLVLKNFKQKAVDFLIVFESPVKV